MKHASHDRHVQSQVSSTTHHHLSAHEVVLLLETDMAKG